MKRFLSLLTVLLCAAMGHAQTVVVDQGLGTQVSSLTVLGATIPILGGELLTVDAAGKRTLLSDFGDPSKGPIGAGGLRTATWIPSGLLGLGQTILAVDSFAGTNGHGALFAVNETTGMRTILSDFGNTAQGMLGGEPDAIVVGNGLLGLGTSIYVLDNDAGTNQVGVLFKINPATGNRTVLSDFGDSKQGAVGVNPVSIAVVPQGLLNLLGVNAGFVVLDDDAGTVPAGATSGAGALFVVDITGKRTLLSDFGDSKQGALGTAPQEVATTPAGFLWLGTAIYVTDNEAGTNNLGGLLQVLPDGSRTLVSDFGYTQQGTLGDNPTGVVFDGLGNLLVTDDFLGSSPTQAKLFAVNLYNGQRSVRTDCSTTSLGPCSEPVAVTQVP